MDEDVLLFIKGCIRSVWALEVLVFMRGRRDRTWTVEDLARELRASPKVMDEVLATFDAAGLLANRPDGRIFAPASQAMDTLSGRLEQTYRLKPVAVVNAIVSSRSDPLQALADAFRIKGTPKR